MSAAYDVLIIGGGIVGMSAAIAMSQRHLSVALLDAGTLRVDTHPIDSRVYAINQASQSLLQTLGAWAYLESARVSPYQRMHVWDASNGAHIDFDARMMGVDRLGSIIEESIIKQALKRCISERSVTIIPQCRITEVQANPDEILISDGTTQYLGKLLIIADGAHSATRELLGVSITSWPYHQQAIVTTLQTEKPHLQTAFQVFNPDGPLAFLPLASPYQCSIVWSTTPSKANTLLGLSEDAFAETIATAFSHQLGGCKVLSPRHQFPLHMRHAKQYSGPRWLLMGDAAHTIHPLAGLGLNVGLADLAAWLSLMDADKRPLGSSTAALGRYQRMRKVEVWKMIALMEGLKTIFANPLPPITALRGLGIQACNHLLPLKRFFIEFSRGG